MRSSFNPTILHQQSDPCKILTCRWLETQKQLPATHYAYSNLPPEPWCWWWYFLNSCVNHPNLRFCDGNSDSVTNSKGMNARVEWCGPWTSAVASHGPTKIISIIQTPPAFKTLSPLQPLPRKLDLSEVDLQTLPAACLPACLVYNYRTAAPSSSSESPESSIVCKV